MNKNIDNESLYKILGISKKASSTEIKKAYRKLAMINHPDKGGEADKFKEITDAYEILSNDEKRNIYDERGKEGLKPGGGIDPSDIFNNMFNMGGMGGMGGMKKQQGKKKGKTLIHNINITLKDIYNGKKKKLKIKRKIIDKEKVKTCNTCNGSGIIKRSVRMGPMIQQIQSPCSVCNQLGYIYNSSESCETVELFIPKGSKNKHKVVLYEKGDDVPNGDAGDIHVIINVKEDETFKRHGSDLYIKKNINLTEALSGVNFDLEHLDGRKLIIKTKNKDIISPLLFDPFKINNDYEWKEIKNTSSSLEPHVRAEINDAKLVKEVIESGQLKNENINAFMIKGNTTYFYNNDNNEINSSKNKSNNSVLYVKTNTDNSNKIMKCIEDEGLPLFDNPSLNGNLFIEFVINFPKNLPENIQQVLIEMGFPKPLNISKYNSDKVETHYLTDKNPIESYKQNFDDSDTSDDDEIPNRIPSEGVQQCSQQ